MTLEKVQSSWDKVGNDINLRIETLEMQAKEQAKISKSQTDRIKALGTEFGELKTMNSCGMLFMSTMYRMMCSGPCDMTEWRKMYSSCKSLEDANMDHRLVEKKFEAPFSEMYRRFLITSDVFLDSNQHNSRKTRQNKRAASHFEFMNLTTGPKRKIARYSSIRSSKSSVLFEFCGFSIYLNDFESLNPQQWLSDTIIDSNLKYALEHGPQARKTDTFIFGSCLFNDREAIEMVADRHEKYHRWTQGIDILRFDHLIIPVCRNDHWTLIVVSFLSELRQDRRTKSDSGKKPCILAFDSKREVDVPFFDEVREFVVIATDKERMQRVNSINLPAIQPPTPQQSNGHDCGIFCIQYAEEFLKNPVRIRENNMISNLSRWFDADSLSSKRKEIKERMWIQPVVKLVRCDNPTTA